MSELTVGSIAGLAANSFVVDVASGSTLDLSAGAVFPAGSIIQVVSTTKTDTFSTTSTSFVDITGLSATITPRSTSSKIFVVGGINLSGSATGSIAGLNLLRDSTSIGQGAVAGSRTPAISAPAMSNNTNLATMGVNFLDSPSTTASTIYKFQLRNTFGGETVFVNQAGSDTDSVSRYRVSSTITVMEVAG